MIFVDSGAWYSSLIPTDPDHAAALAWLAQNTEALLTTDYIGRRKGVRNLLLTIRNRVPA